LILPRFYRAFTTLLPRFYRVFTLAISAWQQGVWADFDVEKTVLEGVAG